MFKPEEMHLQTLETNSVEIAKIIMSLQNENPFPETGTLGFIMGLAIALGNTASVYCTGQNPRQRKDFERIFTGMAKDCFRHPFAEGVIFEEGTIQ